MHDICENPLNVNYNRGAWLDTSKFDRGYSGPANGMYGRKMTDVCSPEKLAEMKRKRAETMRAKSQAYRDTHNGMLPHEYKAYKHTELTKKLNEINHQIREAHGYYDKTHFHGDKKALKEYQINKAASSKWYYNPLTGEETFTAKGCPEGWTKGRLPHSMWSEERKKSYADKHKFNPFANKSEEWMEEYSMRCSENQKGKICYTDGVHNRYLMQGENIPDGFYKGCTFKKSDLYWNTRRKKQNG